MAINTQKVLVGGFAAGIVLLLIDWLSTGVLLAERMKAEAEAFKPGMSQMMMETSSMVMYVITDLVVGMMLVWTYAAIRPRFGPGPRTAALAALLFWILGALLTAGYLSMGMMSMGTWWMYSLIWLVNLMLAAFLGAKLYTEEGSATVA